MRIRRHFNPRVYRETENAASLIPIYPVGLDVIAHSAKEFYENPLETLIVELLIKVDEYTYTSSSKTPPKIRHPKTPTYPHCAATLILSCLSLCCACKTSLSTAYSNLSFFPLICFNRSASLPSPISLSLPLPIPFLVVVPVSRPSSSAPPSRDIRPSSNSHRAIKACSRRSRRSRWVSTRERRDVISGVRVARREDCAVERADEGRISKCWSSWGEKDVSFILCVLWPVKGWYIHVWFARL